MKCGIYSHKQLQHQLFFKKTIFTMEILELHRFFFHLSHNLPTNQLSPPCYMLIVSTFKSYLHNTSLGCIYPHNYWISFHQKTGFQLTTNISLMYFLQAWLFWKQPTPSPLMIYIIMRNLQLIGTNQIKISYNCKRVMERNCTILLKEWLQSMKQAEKISLNLKKL